MHMDIEAMRNAVYKAAAKLEHIIAREGDMDGARREPWYLEMLIQEQILSEGCRNRFGGLAYEQHAGLRRNRDA